VDTSKRIMGFFTKGRGRHRKVHPITIRKPITVRHLLRGVYIQSVRSMDYDETDDVKYPDENQVIKMNKEVLEYTRGHRVEIHRVRNPEGISQTLKRAQEIQGDLYDKAVELLVGLIKTHPFESGNRRTAFLVTSVFLKLNGEEPPDLSDEKILTWIRRGLYSREEIKKWLMGYGIKEFGKRR